METKTKSMIAAREEILGKLRELLIDKLQIDRTPEELDPDVALFGTGFGLDSLDAVEIMIFLETEFGLKLSVTQPMLQRISMRTLNTLTDMVLEMKKGAPIVH